MKYEMNKRQQKGKECKKTS